MSIRLTVIYDNYSIREEIKPAWGFSCLVEGAGGTVMFDTGGHGPTLLANMAELGISPSAVDALVLSHRHWDHTGGLEELLRANSNMDVYALESFPAKLKDAVRRAGAGLIEVTDPAGIFPWVSTTGKMVGAKGPEEQALVVSARRGTAVITGCAHPGVVQIAERAKDMTHENIFLVLGGFHLYKDGEDKLTRVISRLKELGVARVAPCHCSGDPARGLLRESFGERYVNCNAGKTLET